MYKGIEVVMLVVMFVMFVMFLGVYIFPAWE